MTISEPALHYDIPLLRKAVEHAEAYPEEFNFARWIGWPEGARYGECGTTACLAGRIVLLADGPEVHDYGRQELDEDCRPTGYLVAVLTVADGRVMDIRSRAAQLIGIDFFSSTTDRLFGVGEHFDRDMPASDLRRHVEEALGVTL